MRDVSPSSRAVANLTILKRNPNMVTQMFSVGETAEMTGLSEDTIQRLHDGGHLRAFVETVAGNYRTARRGESISHVNARTVSHLLHGRARVLEYRVNGNIHLSEVD